MEREVIYRVKDNPDYIKDDDSGAVLNTNVAKLKEYKLRKRQNRKIEDLQSEVAELKALLRVVLEGQKCQ
ncbi:MAG: hypothetical protein EBY03_05335 [Actinobacteria bacterium]|jgi:hypothetical protein|nr:hypothetical protein [Actinomycetota bacterium]